MTSNPEVTNDTPDEGTTVTPEDAEDTILETPEENNEPLQNLDDFEEDPTLASEVDETEEDTILVGEDASPVFQEESIVSTVPYTWEVDTSGDTPLIFFLNEQQEVLSTIPLTPEYMSDLMATLNEFYIAPEEEPSTWVIRIPDVPDALPVFSIVRGGKILGSVQPDREEIAEIVPVLQSYVPAAAKKTTVWQRMLRWAKRHKILATLVGILFLPVIAGVVLAIAAQIQATYF